jgi:dTDP-4-amino-4,6-dideoxygalactose transaminase
MNFLKKSGIDTMIHYPYMLSDLKFFNSSKRMENSNNLGQKILSLPISEEHTAKEILYVCNKIRYFFAQHKN